MVKSRLLLPNWCLILSNNGNNLSYILFIENIKCSPPIMFSYNNKSLWTGTTKLGSSVFYSNTLLPISLAVCPHDSAWPLCSFMTRSHCLSLRKMEIKTPFTITVKLIATEPRLECLRFLKAGIRGTNCSVPFYLS